jgi:hypothetical protein
MFCFRGCQGLYVPRGKLTAGNRYGNGQLGFGATSYSPCTSSEGHAAFSIDLITFYAPYMKRMLAFRFCNPPSLHIHCIALVYIQTFLPSYHHSNQLSWAANATRTDALYTLSTPTFTSQSTSQTNFNAEKSSYSCCLGAFTMQR